MGLTNNEVKFLVTLDIDEDKSKKKIDGFLEKTIKEQKIVFDVSVGKSEQNINEFLKKHKEKKASILFDVAVGKSNTNISNYLSNRKQDTQSLVFYVNEGATRTRINGVLSTMSFNPALIELKVDTKLSLANINKFIDNSKIHKKNIELDVDSNTGFASINEKIDKKKLHRAKIILGLETGAFDDIGDAVKNRVFTGAKFVGSLDVDATKQRIEGQISRMKLPKLTVDVEPIVAQIKQPKTSTLTTPVKQTTPTAPTTTDDLLVGSQKDVFKQIKDEYKKLGQTVELFNKSREEGEEAFVERLKKQGKQVEIIRNAQTREITKITTTYKNSANETQKDVFVPFVKSYKDTANASNEAVKEVRGFVAETNKLKNTEKFNLSKEVDEFKRKLEEARHSATATARVLDEFGRKANSATSRNEIDKLNKDLVVHQAEQRKRNQLDKEKIQLTAQQEQLMANLTRIQKMYLRTVDKDEANRIRQSVEALKQLDILKANGKDLYKLDMGSVREAREQVSLVNNDIKRLNANATEASKASLGVIASVKTAMEKFPIWMLASTAFFGVIATFREFGSVIVDIDKKMTDLKKVMSEDTDFGAIFDQATHSAETFGKTISETLDAYNMFAKQGFKGAELETLANAGLVAGNVGDIEAGKASEYLTASILQWDKDTNEAMSVVDSWNEISNNFATTVENLAQGQAKAGATARALGMDFDQLNAVVGTLNARTKQSGNEIGNFVKSTFANILGNKAGSILDELGIDLENADGTMRDIMDVYKDVAKVYVTLDQADKNRVTLGLAGKYHISRMQTLLDDLGKADSMYDQMYDSSQNSANSAMSENQKYMQSLEARINLARVEIEKLALAVGEAFMTEGMIQALQAFRIFAETVTMVVKEVGFLPVALLSVITALALISNRFSDVIGRATQFVGSMTKAKKATDNLTDSTLANNRATKNATSSTTLSSGALANDTTKTNQNTVATDRNTEAKKRASKASKLLSLGFGALGLGAIAVGFGIEKLLGWLGKARQEQEDYANKVEEETASYSASREAIGELAREYEKLSEAHSEGKLDPNTEEYKKYTEVQNELANLLPDLKAGEDGLGNSYLKSNSYIKLKIEMLEKQLEAQKALNEEEAKAKLDEEIETARDTIKDSKKTVDKSLGNGGDLAYKLKFVDQNYSKQLDFEKDGKKVSLMDYLGIGEWGEDLKDVEQLMKTINAVQQLLNNKEQYKLSDGQVSTLTWVLQDLELAYNDASNASNTIASANETLRGSYADTMKAMIDSTDNLADETKANFEEIAFSALSLADTEEEFEAISSAFGEMTKSTYSDKGKLVNALSSLTSVTTQMKESGITDVSELEARYKDSFEKIKNTILSLSGFKVGSDEYKALSEALDRVTVDVYDYEVQVLKSANATGKSKEATRELLEAKGELEEGVSSLSEELAEEIKKLEKLDTFYEKLTGVSEAQIEKTEELVYVYDTLSSKTERTAEENEYLEETFKTLNALYPHLTKNGQVRTKNVMAENDAYKALHEAYKASKDGILSAEEALTLEQAQNIMVRMNNLIEEAQAIQDVIDAYNETKRITSGDMKVLKEVGFEAKWEGFNVPSSQDIAKQAEEFYEEKSTKIEDYSKKIQDATKRLNTSVKNATSREKEREKTQKDSEKTQTLLQKVTEKYALTLDDIQTKLEKVNAKKSKYAKHTEAYRKAIKEENALLQEQLGIYKSQAKELGASVVNGGSYSITSPTASKQLSGWNHKITSGYGAKESFRKSPHTGVDIDGYMGERLDANVAGKVIKRGSNSVSGNYVKIRDNEGYEHFYGHLKTITAKLDQVVKVGDKIGEIGNTGNVVKNGSSDGSHLHYEIKLNGKQVDPTNFATGAKGVKTLNLSTNSSPSSSKASGNSAQATVWNYFKSKGLNDNAVAGIMGNVQQESGFNSKAVNKSSGATGIFQWLGSRLKELKAYASKQGKSHTDLQTQLDFAWKELQSTEKKSLASLQKSKSVTQHASDFEKLFERSGGSAVAKRQNFASQFYNQYAGSGSSASSISNGGYDSESESQVYNLMQQEQKILDQLEANRFEIMTSTLDEYTFKKDMQENEIARQDAIKAGYLTTSDLWEQATNAQYNAQKAVRQNINDELWQLNQYLEKSNLTEAQRFTLLERQAQLNIQLNDAFNGIKEYYSQVVQGRLDRFDNNRTKYQTEIDWEAVKIQSVDPDSERYVATLQRANGFREKLVQNIAEEQKYINKQLASGKLTIDMYKTLTERAKELKKESIEAMLALQQANYEIIQAGANASNRRIDDIDYDIDRSKGYASLYEEGSADQKRELEFQLDRLNDKLLEIENRGKEIQVTMRDMNLGHAELEELEEQLEDNALAYLDVKNAISSTKKELKDFNKIIDDQIKDKREELADDILDTLKDAYEELRDIENERFENLMEQENERHDKVIKNYDDELKSYNKIIDAKRREIEDSDRNRTHNNNIEELTKEKEELQRKLNLLSNVNTYEGRKEREELQKQVDEVNKKIVEENYQYEKDLRTQQLDDLLEEKTEYIDELKEQEDEYNEKVIKDLEKQQKYWDKYYEDLINDEREFERLREQMLDGHFEEIESLFAEHAGKLKASLPDLELSITGMTERVGTQIRENVIHELENLVKEIQRVEKEVSDLNKLKDTISNEHGSSVQDKPNNNYNNENGQMSEADLKVVLAKFMNEQIASKTSNASRAKNIKDKSYALAEEGRKQGATISSSDSLDKVMSSLSSSQIKQVGDYFKSNASQSGFSTQEYLDYINNWGNNASSTGSTLTRGDKQVMMAKYINEKLVTMTDNKATREALKNTSYKIAQSGRSNGSIIGDSVGYDSQYSKLTQPQRNELGQFMLDQSSVVGDSTLRSKMQEYAENLVISNSKNYVGLDTGGMTKAFGSSGGVDGKGGKMALLHERELIFDPVDTGRILKVSSIMDNIMKNIGRALALPTLSKPTVPTSASTSDNSTHVSVHVDKMYGTKSDIDNLSKQIQNRLLREKGKR